MHARAARKQRVQLSRVLSSTRFCEMKQRARVHKTNTTLALIAFHLPSRTYPLECVHNFVFVARSLFAALEVCVSVQTLILQRA